MGGQVSCSLGQGDWLGSLVCAGGSGDNVGSTDSGRKIGNSSIHGRKSGNSTKKSGNSTKLSGSRTKLRRLLSCRWRSRERQEGRS